MRKFIFNTLDWLGWLFVEAHHKLHFPTYRLGCWFYDRALDYGIKHNQLVRNSREGAAYIFADEDPDRIEANTRYARLNEIEYEITKAIYWHRKRTHLYEERQTHRTWLLEHGK